jgi:hypothetical protein
MPYHHPDDQHGGDEKGFADEVVEAEFGLDFEVFQFLLGVGLGGVDAKELHGSGVS